MRKEYLLGLEQVTANRRVSTLDSLGSDQLCKIGTEAMMSAKSDGLPITGQHLRSTSATALARMSFCVFSSLIVFRTFSMTDFARAACSFSFACCS